MDIAPRSLSRWLPWLGRALIAEALFGFGPPILGSELTYTTFVDLPYLLWILFFGIAVARKTRDYPERDTCLGLLYGGLAAVLGTALNRFSAVYFYDYRFGGLLLMALGSMALSLCAPAILGAALARRMEPEAERLRLLTKAPAVLALSGFVLLAVSETIQVVFFKSDLFRALRLSGIQVLYELLNLATRGCLFACAVLSVRPIPENEDPGRRPLLLIRLMLAWALTSCGTWIIAGVASVISVTWHFWVAWQEYLWRGLIELTLFPTVAILLALTFEKPGLRYKPWRNRHSHGGAGALDNRGQP